MTILSQSCEKKDSQSCGTSRSLFFGAGTRSGVQRFFESLRCRRADTFTFFGRRQNSPSDRFCEKIAQHFFSVSIGSDLKRSDDFGRWNWNWRSLCEAGSRKKVIQNFLPRTAINSFRSKKQKVRFFLLGIVSHLRAYTYLLTRTASAKSSSSA